MKYSDRALYNRFFRNGRLELCNNDCGRMIYHDIETDTIRNATGTDADLLHKDSCDFLQDLKKAARSFNWYPNLAIDEVLENVFNALDEIDHKHSFDFSTLYRTCRELRDSIYAQRTKNEETRKKWDMEKGEKAEWKKHTPEAKARGIDQQSQYNELLKDPDFRKKWNIDPVFTTGDKLV